MKINNIVARTMSPTTAPMIAAIGGCVAGEMLVDAVPKVSVGRWVLVDDVLVKTVLDAVWGSDKMLVADALLML